MSEELKTEYPDLEVSAGGAGALAWTGLMVALHEAGKTIPHGKHEYVHKSKLRAYEAQIEGLKAHCKSCEREAAKHVFENINLREENEQLKAQLSVALEAMKEIDEMYGLEMWNCERCGHSESTKDCDNHHFIKQAIKQIEGM